MSPPLAWRVLELVPATLHGVGRRTVKDLWRRGAVSELIELLRSGSWRDREGAAEALGALADPAAVEALGECLGHANRRVRDAAANALGEIPTPRAAELLVEVITQPYVDVVAGDYARGHEVFVILTAANALARLGPEIRGLADEMVEELTARLKSGGAEEQQLAAQVMGATRDPRFVPALAAELTAALRQGKKRRRGLTDEMRPWVLLEALGVLGDAGAIRAVRSALGDHDPNVREAAARALVRLGDKRGLDYFRAVLHDDRDRAWVALSNLGELGATELFDEIAPFLSDGDWTVRREAAVAVGRIGNADTPDKLLTPLLADAEEGVRLAARTALSELAERRAAARRRRRSI